MSISKKRLELIKKIKDKEINYSDIAELDEGFFQHAELKLPKPKKIISIRLDHDVLDWFKSSGGAYQTKINAILKAYMESQEGKIKRRIKS